MKATVVNGKGNAGKSRLDISRSDPIGRVLGVVVVAVHGQAVRAEEIIPVAVMVHVLGADVVAADGGSEIRSIPHFRFVRIGAVAWCINVVCTIKGEHGLYAAVFYVLGKIAGSISGIEETYRGTKTFRARNIRDVFRNKTVNYTDPHDGGIGISQNDPSVKNDWKIDLSAEDWFVYTDNYGTSEEKAFVAYFRGYVADLRKIYDRIFLVRNEREFYIYSFEDGERFEPDYVLFLQKNKMDGFEQLQIFIEPKGTQLLEKDAWKEKFLLQLKAEAVPTTIFVDDNDYKILGLHFFNQENRMKEFDSEFAALIGK